MSDARQARHHAPGSDPDRIKDDLLVRHRVADSDDSSGDDRDHRAGIDDEAAKVRDDAADARDRTADARDRAAEQASAGAADHRIVVKGHEVARPPSAERRQAARRDRADAARDRTAAKQNRVRAGGDRGHSKRARGRAAGDRDAAIAAAEELIALLTRAQDDAENMLQVGQAQGLLMASRQISPLEALLEVGVRAARDRTELGTAARGIIDEVST